MLCRIERPQYRDLGTCPLSLKPRRSATQQALRGLWLVGVALLIPACASVGTRHAPLPVPPHLEIEVIDPGVDPLGNPSVRILAGNNERAQVDIPPTVLVHRYYYSGDRSFQGPLLPGGPTIAVVNHPVTGERCYLELQMMPGAPRVFYSARSIEYDYGSHSTFIRFPKYGCPQIVYRNGTTFSRAVAETLHWDELRSQWRAAQQHWHDNRKRCRTMAQGALLELGDGIKLVFLPLANAATMVPLVTPLVATDWEARWTERAAVHQHDVAARRAAREARLRELDRPTIR